ncbi:hypothetical protein [Gilvimarinus chinensis]|uniref:hypothetical protein n=1 Tax=Gilvimarinus chinensis TaxID=396005 RepID=UPI00035E4EA6|nr:hypothetical protein [Gilvimarinus chinensis]
MPIDFTHLYTASSAKTGAPAVDTGVNRQTSHMLAALGLKTGEPANAQVVTVKHIKPEHQLWLDRERPGSIPPPTSKTTEPLSALRLATLLIKGQNLAVITREALQPGQALTVTLNSARQLTFGPESAAVAPLRESPAAGAAAQRAQLSPETLNQALREVLPRQTAPRLEPLAEALSRLFTKLPPAPEVKSLASALQRIASAPMTLAPANPIEPATLKAAIQHSGSLFETNLAKASTTGPEAVKQVLALDRKANLIQLAKQVATQLPAPSSLRSEPSPPLAQLTFTPRETADSTVIARLLTSAPPSPTTAGLTTPSINKPPSAGATAFTDVSLHKSGNLNLNQILLNPQNIPTEAAEARVLRTQLMLLTHQLTLNSLARIRQQQLQPEANRARTLDTPAGTNIHFDLPIRIDEQIYPVKIAIQEQANAETANPAGKKGKLWHVNLTLETPDAGLVYTRISYLNRMLDIVFWGENKTVISNAKATFSDYVKPLAAAGLEISSVQFLQGAPASDGNSLAYNLVDIRS